MGNLNSGRTYLITAVPQRDYTFHKVLHTQVYPELFFRKLVLNFKHISQICRFCAQLKIRAVLIFGNKAKYESDVR